MKVLIIVSSDHLYGAGLVLCSMVLKSGLVAGLALSRFREWVGCRSCMQQVQRVGRVLDLYATGSESA